MFLLRIGMSFLMSKLSLIPKANLLGALANTVKSSKEGSLSQISK